MKNYVYDNIFWGSNAWTVQNVFDKLGSNETVNVQRLFTIDAGENYPEMSQKWFAFVDYVSHYRTNTAPRILLVLRAAELATYYSGEVQLQRDNFNRRHTLGIIVTFSPYKTKKFKVKYFEHSHVRSVHSPGEIP